MKDGGLGIVDLKIYNKATNLCMCWHFLNKEQDWVKLLAARVLRNGKVITYSIKSSLWKGVKEHYTYVLENTRWILGNGEKVNFGIDDWIGVPLVKKFNIPEIFHHTLTSKVAEFWSNNQWSLHANLLLDKPEILPAIAAYSIMIRTLKIGWPGKILRMVSCLSSKPMLYFLLLALTRSFLSLGTLMLLPCTPWFVGDLFTINYPWMIIL